MSHPVSRGSLSSMVSLPPLDRVSVTAYVEGGTAPQVMTLDLLRQGFMGFQSATPTNAASSGAANSVAVGAQHLYVRGSSGWGRIPFAAAPWDGNFNTLVNPVIPSMTEAPEGAPAGYLFLNSGTGLLSYLNSEGVQVLNLGDSFNTLSDGTHTAQADSDGVVKFRSSDSSLLVVVTADDETHGNNVNLTINAGAINVGDFVDDDTYALKIHDHDADYAAIDHNHDLDYATIDHDHDADYSAIGHTHTGVYAPVSHNHSASALNSGTLDDARVAVSNVTQHTAYIAITGLSGYSDNKYIDHTGVSIIAGAGLSGGGTIAANRTLALDFAGMDTGTAASGDLVAVYDISLAKFIQVDIDTLTGGGGSTNASDIDSGLLDPAYGGLGADVSGITGPITLTAGVASALSVLDPTFGGLGADVSGISGPITLTAGVASALTTLAPNYGGLGADVSGITGMIKLTSGVASAAVSGTDYGAPADVSANTAARHTQGTDTGTTSAYFQLLTGTNGGRVSWNNGGQDFRLRTYDDSAYADLRVADLHVTGTLYADGGITEIVSNEVNIGDSLILLNSDLALGSANSDGGIGVKLLDTDDSTRRDAEFYYDVSARRWVSSGFTATTEAPITKRVPGVHSELIGDGVEVDYTVTHKLNTKEVAVAVWEVSTGALVIVDVVADTVDTVVISFGASSVPGTDAYRVVIVG